MVEQLNEIIRKDPANDLNELKVTDGNRQILTDIADYICFKGNLDYRKGIVFSGSVGTGKTMLIELLRRLIFEFWGKVMTEYNAPFIRQAYYNKPGPDEYSLPYQLASYKFIAINDMGFEQDYASGGNIIQTVLFDRFEKRLYTFGSTNLAFPQFVDRYNDDMDRMKDRMKLMFNWVLLTGKSFR